MTLLAARIYDALSAGAVKSRAQIAQETRASNTTVYMTLMRMVGEGVVVELRPPMGKKWRQYRLAAGAQRPSEEAKPNGFQQMAASRCDCDGAPEGIVRRAIAVTRLDPLVRWAHSMEVEG